MCFSLISTNVDSYVYLHVQMYIQVSLDSFTYFDNQP